MLIEKRMVAYLGKETATQMRRQAMGEETTLSDIDPISFG